METTMNNLQKNLFELLASIVRTDSVGEVRAEDPVALLNLSFQYKIITVIYNYIADSKAKEIFTGAIVQSNVINANQQLELKRILDYAETNGIFLLLLKGFCVGKFYPAEGFREMCDIDLYYKTEQKSRVEGMMQELGFVFRERKENHETWAKKDCNVFVELHFSIADISDGLLSEILDRKIGFENYKNIFCMTDEDLYFYLLVHLHHHLKNGTYNFRQLLDIFVMKEKVGLDFSKVDKMISRVDLKLFNDNINKALDYIFDGVQSADVEGFVNYLSGNISFENNAIAKLASDSRGRVGFALKRMFPKKEKFLIEYPYYKNRTLLLPVGYVKRIIHILKDKKEDAFYQYQVLKKIDDKMIDNGREQKMFLGKYGIKS